MALNDHAALEPERCLFRKVVLNNPNGRPQARSPYLAEALGLEWIALSAGALSLLVLLRALAAALADVERLTISGIDQLVHIEPLVAGVFQRCHVSWFPLYVY